MALIAVTRCDGVRTGGRKFFGRENAAGAFGLRKLCGQLRICGRVFDGLAVDDELFVTQFDGVAGQADDPFDQPRAVLRRMEYHNVAALWIAPFG